MATEVHTGIFNTGTGAASTTKQVTGLGFQPKGIVFFWNGRTEATDTVGRTNMRVGSGITDGTNDRAIAAYDLDNSAGTDSGNYLSTGGCIVVTDGTGAVSGELALQSFDSDGFTLVVNTQMPLDLRVMYFAIGGSTITNVAVGTQTLPASTTGSQSVTGLSFQPEFGFFIGCELSGNGGSDSRSGFGFGTAISATSEATMGVGADDAAATTDTGGYIYTGECVTVPSTSNPTNIDGRAEFTSWNSDGYTLNVLEMPGFDRDVLYFVVEGGSWSIDTITTQTDTTTEMSISGLSFAPNGGIIFSTHRTESTQDTGTTPLSCSFGVFHSTTDRWSLGTLNEDGLSTSEIDLAVEHDAVYVNIATDATVQGLMDVQSMNNDGVDFIMDDADPSGVLAIVVTAGDPDTGLEINIDYQDINDYEQGVKVYT